MYPSQHMVVVNIIASMILLSIVSIYRFVWPKRKISLFWLLMFLSILPIISLLRPGDYESGDFNIHLYRAMDFYSAIKDGQWMPSWPEHLNATYGYPVFVYLNPIPYYLISLLHFIGFFFINSEKICFGASYLLSGIFIWMLGKKIFKDDMTAFVTGVFFQFAPYHFVDMHFRAAIGETMGFTLFPLAIYMTILMVEKRTVQILLWSSALIGFFIMVHQAIATFAMGVIIVYYLFLCWNQKRINLKNILYLVSTISLGLLLSVYSWIGHIVHSRYSYQSVDPLQIVFPKLQELLYSPWRFGLLFQGNRGELSYIIGYTQLFVIVLAFILLFKGKLQKKIKSEFVFWLSLFVLLIFFISSFSHFIWRWFPILNSIQFSTRLLVVVALDISVLVGFVSKFLIKKSVLIWLLVIVTIGYTILNWGQRRVIAAKDDNAVRQAVWISTCCDGEAFGNFGTPKWLDSKHRWQTKLPPSHLQVLSGQAITKELFHNSIKHEYLAYATDSAYLMENTLYFPGWHLMVDNKEEQINYLNRDHLGIITFKIPSGIHYIQVLYRDIPIHVAAKIITVVGFSIIFLYSLVLLLVRLKKRVS